MLGSILILSSGANATFIFAFAQSKYDCAHVDRT